MKPIVSNELPPVLEPEVEGGPEPVLPKPETSDGPEPYPVPELPAPGPEPVSTNKYL